ncbi:hypothetical protein LMG16407_03190 [Pandoraea apista]|nr:hypothetical protein LMG16407_03190 [Pandoraea apista]
MRQNEHTEWFPPEVQPVHKGVYEKQNTSTGTLFFAYWNGYWGPGAPFPEVAHMYRWQVSVRPNWPWRGLAKET